MRYGSQLSGALKLAPVWSDNTAQQKFRAAGTDGSLIFMTFVTTVTFRNIVRVIFRDTLHALHYTLG